MNEVATAFAKLAGIRTALSDVLDKAHKFEGRPLGVFSPLDVQPYFDGVDFQLHQLRVYMPALFDDFPPIPTKPDTEMTDRAEAPFYFSLRQIERLARTIDQILETRANSELAVPMTESEVIASRVFITHGQADDWHEVQSYIEKDVGLPTLELAQEPNLGRTVLQKLEQESAKCTSAVIVMTGDDSDADGNLRTRENVMHEIGYFQAKFGLAAVCLLHEEGIINPSNIHGLVYIPFPKRYVSATFGLLMRELKSFYSL